MDRLLFYSVSAIFIFVIAYFWDKKNKNIANASTYEDVEKLADFDGDFEYRDDGFYVKLKDSKRFVKWAEIIHVISKKYSVVGESDIVYQIQTENELFEIDYDKSGFYKFIIKLEENLEILPTQKHYYNLGKEEIIYEKVKPLD